MSATAPSRPVNPSRSAGTAPVGTVARLFRLVIGRQTVRLLLLATTCLACSRDGGGVAAPASSPSKLLPEKPGQLIAAGVLSSSSRMRWERDDEITYTGLDETGARSQLRVVHVANGTIRVIDTAPIRDARYAEFAVSRDGRHTFFLLGGALYFAATDSARVPIANFPGVGNSLGRAVLTGADAAQVIYRTEPDSVWLYDVPSQTRRVLAAGCRSIVTVSPDGRQLLCQSVSQTFSIVDIGSGAVSPSNALTGPTSAIQSIHWGPRGIEHIRSGAFYFTELVNGASGAVTTLIASTEGQPVDLTNIDMLRLSSLAWSRDGRSIAYSRDLCYSPGWSQCAGSQSQLYVFDVASKATRLAAVVNRDISSIAFSPDGTRIGYLAGAGFSSAMYVAPLP